LNRIHSLDFLRGIAVLIMLFANTAPYVLAIDNSYFFRLIFSSAAPIFIFLSGYTIELKLKTSNLNFFNFLRPIQILIIGVLIDICVWRIYPFLTFDVLYLISFSQILLIALNYSSKKVILKVILFFIFLILVIFFKFEYRFIITEPEFGSYLSIPLLKDYNPIKRLFLDGWFPILPWFAIALLGSLYSSIEKIINSNRILLFLISSILLIAYSVFNSLNYLPVSRVQYLELWYPLKDYMFCFVLGCILFSIFVLKSNLLSSINELIKDFFITIGRNSLFIYLFQTVIINVYLSLFINNTNNSIFNLAIFFSIILIVVVFGILIDVVKNSKYWHSIPYIFKYLLGY
jgi:uncharacterized protein